MIHADFPDAVGIETEVIHTDTSLDYDQLAKSIEKAGLAKQEVKAILASAKRQEVIVRGSRARRRVPTNVAKSYYNRGVICLNI